MTCPPIARRVLIILYLKLKPIWDYKIILSVPPNKKNVLKRQSLYMIRGMVVIQWHSSLFLI